MAKTARRSVVVSDPSSSPSSLSSLLLHQQQQYHHHQQSSSTSPLSSPSSPSSPLPPRKYQQPTAHDNNSPHSDATASVAAVASVRSTAADTTSFTTTTTVASTTSNQPIVVVDPLRPATSHHHNHQPHLTSSYTTDDDAVLSSRATAAASPPSSSPPPPAPPPAAAVRRLASTVGQPASANTIDGIPEHSKHHHNGHSRQFGATSTPAHTAPALPHRPSMAPATPTALPPTFNTSRIHDRVAVERERVRTEFYATYDVMTGVRIAATLGGFFGLMVFLVVYKSRGESQETIKALKDPKIAAAAAAVMQEEEDRELQEAMEATGMSIYPDEYDHIGYGRQRLMSVGNISAPPVFNRGYRFSSIGGGYSSLLSPTQRRFSYSESGRNSVSASSRVLGAYPMGGSFGIDDYFAESDGDDEADDEFDPMTTTSTSQPRPSASGRPYEPSSDARTPTLLLSVPQAGGESRRSSNITCCSTESSYLERRCSAVTLGLQPLPSIATPAPSRRTARTANHQSHNDHDPMDLFATGHPGIQVIQPTPRTSPSGSQRNSRERQGPAPPSSASHAPPLSAQTQLRSKSLSLEHQPRSLDSITVYTSSTSSDDKLVSVTAGVDERSSMMMVMMSDTGSRPTRSRTTLDDGPTTMATTTFSCTASRPSHPSVAPNGRPTPAAAAAGAVAGLRRAPLASISSFKISSVDYQDSDLKSLGSDSVFAESFYADTDDEMEPFSTDSDELTNSDEKRASPRHANVPPVVNHPPTNTTCSTVNETTKPPPPAAHAASRRILQRSSTIYPSSESLPKQQHRSCTIETIATIEPRSSPSPAAAVAARTDRGSLDQSTPPSTRSLPPAMRPVRPAAPAAARRARTTTPPASTSTAVASDAGIAVQPHSQTTPSVIRSTHNHSSGSSASSNSCRSRHAAMRGTADASLADNDPANVNLEMPMISVTDAAGAVGSTLPPLDPSLPAGTARKWSRETLF